MASYFVTPTQDWNPAKFYASDLLIYQSRHVNMDNVSLLHPGTTPPEEPSTRALCNEALDNLSWDSTPASTPQGMLISRSPATASGLTRAPSPGTSSITTRQGHLEYLYRLEPLVCDRDVGVIVFDDFANTWLISSQWFILHKHQPKAHYVGMNQLVYRNNLDVVQYIAALTIRIDCWWY